MGTNKFPPFERTFVYLYGFCIEVRCLIQILFFNIPWSSFARTYKYQLFMMLMRFYVYLKFPSPLNPWVEVHYATHIRGGVGFAAFEG